MLGPAVAREEKRDRGQRDRVLMVDEEEREREREANGESEEGRRIGSTAWGNLINVNAAATAGATRRVWQSLICNSTLPPSALVFLLSLSLSLSFPFHLPRTPFRRVAVPRLTPSLSAITCIALSGQLGVIKHLGKG